MEKHLAWLFSEKSVKQGPKQDGKLVTGLIGSSNLSSRNSVKSGHAETLKVMATLKRT
jgi:hypothetical protein